MTNNGGASPCGNSAGHLDIDLRTVVERGDRAPGRIVAFNRVTEPQSRDIHAGHNGRRSIRACILPAQRNQLVLRILPGNRGHVGLFRGTKLQEIGAPIGIDHEIGDELGLVGLTRMWMRLVGPVPLSVSPMIQRTVSPAATGPEPTSCSPSCRATSVTWPGAA